MTTATQTVKERPILFSGEMVRAILDGRKTMTRRVVKMPRWIEELGGNLKNGFADKAFGVTPCLQVPCSVDESVQRLRNPWMWPEPCRLWVRESLRADERGMFYAADDALLTVPESFDKTIREFVPPSFMPRWASRINLEITNVRVERLQDISEEDAEAEGFLDENHSLCEQYGLDSSWTSCRDLFRLTWDGINGKKHPWSSNPWVWAVEFKKI